VSGSIIQTALTNKALRLELEYRRPSVLREGGARTEEPAAGTGPAVPHDDPQVSDEFACLLSVI
jgi:hypothetical protein